MGGTLVSFPHALIEEEFPYYTNENQNGGFFSGFCDIANHEANGSTIIRPKTNSSILEVRQYGWRVETTHDQRIAGYAYYLDLYGPFPVMLDGYLEMQSYSSGILQCSTGNINHEVLLVGYTSSADPTHPNSWIIKNSWGTGWGLGGYAYITMEYGKDCNISSIFEMV